MKGSRSDMLLETQVEVLLSATLGAVLRRAGGWRSAGHCPVLADLPPELLVMEQVL